MHSAEPFWMVLRTKVTVTPAFLVFAAAMVVLVPLPWIAGWFLSVAVHELSHCAALSLCKVPIHHVTVDIHGARIETLELSGGQTVICALAGPMGGFLLLLAAPIVPRVALCGLLQSAYNLIPVCPLDGGRALHAFLHCRYSEAIANRVCQRIYLCFILTGLLVCIVATFCWKLGILPIIIWFILWLRLRKIKIPCK